MAPFRNTSLDARHSKDEVACFQLDPPSGNFLGENNGRPCMVLPRLVLTFPVLGPLLQEPLFEGRDLQCWTFSALPSDCSIRLSSAGTWSFFGRLVLWLRINNLDLVLAARRCFVRRRTPSWGWLHLLRLEWLLMCHKLGWKVFLLLGSVLLSCRPIGRLVTLRAMLLLPPLTGPWWSWARFGLLLPSIHWPEDVRGTSICSWCPNLSRTTRILDCQTDDHCLRWSSLESRTCTKYFSIQNFVHLLLWLLPGPLLLPTS